MDHRLQEPILPAPDADLPGLKIKHVPIDHDLLGGRPELADGEVVPVGRAVVEGPPVGRGEGERGQADLVEVHLRRGEAGRGL